MENNELVLETVEATEQETAESLPSLSSIFNPEEFFGVNALTDSQVAAILCCISD